MTHNNHVSHVQKKIFHLYFVLTHLEMNIFLLVGNISAFLSLSLTHTHTHTYADTQSTGNCPLCYRTQVVQIA